MTTPNTNTPAVIAADQLAGLCNLTRRRLYQLAEEKKIPPADNGKYPMLETITALFAYYQTDEKNKNRQRLEAAQAQLAELKLKREKKLVVPVADVERVATNVIVQLREVILRIPRNIGSMTGNAQAQRIAENICADALRECAKGLEKLADDEAARDDEETPE